MVQTSRVSAEQTQAFVDAFQRKSDARWEDMKERHRQGKATPEEGLRVMGHARMNLTFRLLSEDIIEEHCRFPLKGPPPDEEARRAQLTAKVGEVTGADSDLVRWVIGDFVAKGYLVARAKGDCLEWAWSETRKPPPRSSAALA